MSERNARSHIEEIQRSYTVGESRVLDTLTGAMQIVEKMFTRSGHFILEFIQNAEDAGAKRVKIVFEDGVIKIFNDGRPFTRDDVEAICSVGRSRKDPRKHIGYLGVGFKAVFLVSSRPHIYSKPYRFKFDKHYWEEKNRNSPWQITPIWLDEVPGEFRDWNVGFYIPIDEKRYEEMIRNELEEFIPTTLLFLHNIDEIELVFGGKRRMFRREKKEENENYTIYTLRVVEGGAEKGTSNWVVFRKVVKVPDEVKADKYTKEWNRDVVECREIAVAFGLDNNGDLTPILGTAKSGVFSYLPLKEEPTELPYYIHADFLVAPGREFVHGEALWNLWMLREIAKLIIERVIKVFKSHEKWKYSYLNVLYKRVHKKLFDMCLANPIIEEIESGPYFATIKEVKNGVVIDGDLAKLSEIAKVDQGILETLGPKGIILIERLTGKKVLHPKVRLPHDSIVKLRIGDVKDLRKYLEGQGLKSARERLEDVWDLVLEWILGPSELVKRLKDPSTSEQEKIIIVRRLKELWKRKAVSAEELIKEGFVIRTKSSKWIEPQKALLPSEYEPYTSVERLVKAGLLDSELVEFVDPVFIENANRDEIAEWKTFLEGLKVGSDENVIKRIVENVGIRVALKYEREKLGIREARPLIESERSKGYDIESKMPDGSPKYIEVKASSERVYLPFFNYPYFKLTRNEYQHILNHPERSFVYVVTDALGKPTLHVIPGTELKDLVPEITIYWYWLSSRVKEEWKPPI